ncbi:hypothetical protein KVR01_012791 [Diaporthe batatas]|uniref:uncharacterized protein n=1 Tax=Diaporthe batatas TaxID=748121 RepID=UPI001D0466B6|nr:uncharacterized protein KVR01_012791 [Diaporthe batatas]KAG8157407.1 hypothetical protein KVR01_012791 [Diaporthe batatas]
MTINLNQLTACAHEVVAHAETLVALSRNGESDTLLGGQVPPPVIAGKFSQEEENIRRSMAMSLAKLQAMVMSPADLLQNIACQNQVLACIQWLCEFQVLAYIPLNNSASLEDIAELASVPKSHLARIVPMTAAVGFLQEPQLGQVAHTPLSSQFVMKPSYHDAAMFLAGVAAPAAINMVKAMRLFGPNSSSPSHSAYNAWQGTSMPFAAMCEQQPHWRRQWPAFLQHVIAGREVSGVELLQSLGCFDRLDSSSAVSVVEIGAETTDRASVLEKQYPQVSFIVQMIRAGAADNFHLSNTRGSGSASNDMELQTNGRITAYYRAIGTPQLVRDASIYILDLSSIGLGRSTQQIVSELLAHKDILRANANSCLVILSHLVPGRGSIPPEEEIMARLRDLSLFQLSNQHLLHTSELSELVHSIHDATGRLAVVKKTCSPTGDAAAIEVRYQPFQSG